ncbi:MULTISPECIES: hypothetical protein [Microbulbifer]|uniref:hypothetical protein n=1 Tax=Microbulbifer TaxID=48073 RepID=UPI0011438165|nr:MULTISPECIES: hypothetical protein [Microbulbifer]
MIRLSHRWIIARKLLIGNNLVALSLLLVGIHIVVGSSVEAKAESIVQPEAVSALPTPKGATSNPESHPSAILAALIFL